MMFLSKAILKKRTVPYFKEKHHFSSDKSIVHRNVDAKQKIVFLILEGILTSTSRDLRMLLSIVVQHFLSSETDE